MSLYTVEISQFENGKFTPIKVPCTIVRENETSYRVRVELPSGEVRVIRKHKSRVFSSGPEIEKSKQVVSMDVDEKASKQNKPTRSKKKVSQDQGDTEKAPKKSRKSKS